MNEKRNIDTNAARKHHGSVRVVQYHTYPASARRGITLSETLVTAALVGLLLIVAALGMDGIRNELKRRQTIGLMAVLDRALMACHQASGRWPVDPAVAEIMRKRAAGELRETEPDYSGSGDRMISQLAVVPAARAVLQAVPEVLRVPHEQAAASADHNLPWTIQDAWGHRLACLTAADPSTLHRKAVAANENRPIFVSAGPDGRFGLTDVSAASDDVRSDEAGK